MLFDLSYFLYDPSSVLFIFLAYEVLCGFFLVYSACIDLYVSVQNFDRLSQRLPSLPLTERLDGTGSYQLARETLRNILNVHYTIPWAGTLLKLFPFCQNQALIIKLFKLRR